MNRKPLIIAISFVAILLGVIVILFFTLFKSGSNKDERADSADYRVFSAVPSDAIALVHFDSFKILDDVILNENPGLSSMLNKEAPLVKFANGLRESYSERFSSQRRERTLLSMHYSDKDEISLLFVQPVSKVGDQSEFLNELLSKFPKNGEKSYGSAIIMNCARTGIFYSLYKDFLVASTSRILVESSLRHLDNAISIIDNKDFRGMLDNIGGDLSLMINYRQIGKFFSGTINRPFLKYADFVSKYATWSVSNYKSESTGLKGHGSLVNIKREENYSSIFLGKKPRESQIYKVTPFSANFVFSLNLRSPKEFRKEYMTYLEANKKINDYNYILSLMKPKEGEKLSPVAWFESLNIDEVGLVSLPIGDEKDERVVLIHDNKKGASTSVGEIVPFEYGGYLSALTGSWFSATSEEYCLNIANWLIIGSEDALVYFADMYADGTFTMYNYLDQLSLYNVVKGENHLSFVLNFNNSAPMLEKIFRKEFIIYPLRGLTGNNVAFGLYNLTSDKKDLVYSSELKIENVAKLPQPKYFSKEGELLASVSTIAKLTVPQGPFEVKNFVNGKMNYLEQSPNNMLRLLDENKKGVWTIPFEYPLCGYVEQVDRYKNGKLQMIFAASDKIWLLDRLGRFVRSYPVSLGKNIALGPKVYDFNGDRNYNIMVLHDDNTIGLYDLDGKRFPGWNDITAKEQIISLPERVKIGDGYYWVLRTQVQTLIFDSLGVIIADFSRKNIINPDSEINIISSKEVELTTIEDRKVILNLEKGTFKRN